MENIIAEQILTLSARLGFDSSPEAQAFYLAESIRAVDQRWAIKMHTAFIEQRFDENGEQKDGQREDPEIHEESANVGPVLKPIYEALKGAKLEPIPGLVPYCVTQIAATIKRDWAVGVHKKWLENQNPAPEKKAKK